MGVTRVCTLLSWAHHNLSLRAAVRWGTRISRVHGENSANEINKSQREKAVEDGLERGTEKKKECETAISLVVNKERTQRGKCETQDKMEFLSVGLDKQLQFCSRDRSQPKRRRRDARFFTSCTNLFFLPLLLFSELAVSRFA